MESRTFNFSWMERDENFTPLGRKDGEVLIEKSSDIEDCITVELPKADKETGISFADAWNMARKEVIFYEFPFATTDYIYASIVHIPSKADGGRSDICGNIIEQNLPDRTDAIRNLDPLTDDDKKLIIDNVGNGEVSSIKRFLDREYPKEDLTGYTWKDIVRAIKDIPHTAPEQLEPIKLVDFMERYCDKTADLQSKRDALYKRASKGEVVLNDIKSHINGGTRVFNAYELKEKWNEYKTVIPTLPPLKP